MAMAKVSEVRMRIERILDESRQIPRGLTRPRWAALLVCSLPLLYFTTVLELAPVRAQEQPRPAAPASPSNMTGEEQLRRAEAMLAEMEARIGKLKAEDMGRLSEQFQTNLAQLQTLQAQLARANEALSLGQEQKLQRETELQNATTHLFLLQELKEKLAEVRSELAQAREVKTPNHPDVKRMEAVMAVLEAQYAQSAQQELLSRAEATTTGPSLISRRDPEYTPEARRARIQGKVELAVTIGADGIAREMKVIRSLDSGLDRKAMECVSQWRFRPASRNGEAITAFATVEVNFKL
jgi:TonB family protein